MQRKYCVPYQDLSTKEKAVVDLLVSGNHANIKLGIAHARGLMKQLDQKFPNWLVSLGYHNVYFGFSTQKIEDSFSYKLQKIYDGEIGAKCDWLEPNAVSILSAEYHGKYIWHLPKNIKLPSAPDAAVYLIIPSYAPTEFRIDASYIPNKCDFLHIESQGVKDLVYDDDFQFPDGLTDIRLDALVHVNKQDFLTKIKPNVELQAPWIFE